VKPVSLNQVAYGEASRDGSLPSQKENCSSEKMLSTTSSALWGDLSQTVKGITELLQERYSLKLIDALKNLTCFLTL
jgi:hypothetical protein